MYWRYIEGIYNNGKLTFCSENGLADGDKRGWRYNGFLTCVEIGSASCSGGKRGWRYIEWQYNEGTLYVQNKRAHETNIIDNIVLEPGHFVTPMNYMY